MSSLKEVNWLEDHSFYSFQATALLVLAGGWVQPCAWGVPTEQP